jgi:hypothetical protein
MVTSRERVIRKMILKIRQTGDLALRHPARNLSSEEILSAPVQSLIAAMTETMRDAPGVGLAAPPIIFQNCRPARWRSAGVPPCPSM